MDTNKLSSPSNAAGFHLYMNLHTHKHTTARCGLKKDTNQCLIAQVDGEGGHVNACVLAIVFPCGECQEK